MNQITLKCKSDSTAALNWHASKYEDIPLVEFTYLVFTHLPGEYEDIPLYVPCIYSFAW